MTRHERLCLLYGFFLLAALCIGIYAGVQVTGAGYLAERIIADAKLDAAQTRIAGLKGEVEGLQIELSRRPLVLDVREGTASWYGTHENGHVTASGEVFDMNAMTAAHSTAPFGTTFIVVRVNDRLPKYHKREIDLSYAAAMRLGIVKQGLARVRLFQVKLADGD